MHWHQVMVLSFFFLFHFGYQNKLVLKDSDWFLCASYTLVRLLVMLSIVYCKDEDKVKGTEQFFVVHSGS